MVLALPLLVGLAVAPLLGGRIGRLGELRLRHLPLFYLALALNVAAFPAERLPWRTSDELATLLWLVAYSLLAVAAASNLRVPGVGLVAAGMASNLAAIVANGAHMPALPSALRAAGLDYAVSRNSAADPSPHAAWLVDRWAAPDWVPLANVYSIGDVLIAAGALVFVLGATGAVRVAVRIPRDAAVRRAAAALSGGILCADARRDPDGDRYALLLERLDRFSPVRGAGEVPGRQRL